MTEFMDEIAEIADDAIKIRNEIGAILAEIYLVTRTWTGEAVGDGSASETKVIVYPAPWIVDLSHNLKLSEAGVIKQGDLLLKQISKMRYPTENHVNCSSTNKLIEKFYEVDGLLYNVIYVKSEYGMWSVQVRKLTDQTRY
jgi:hypothetical protein